MAHKTEPFTSLDLRIEDLRHHIHIESAVQEGADKAITLLQSVKSNDKKAIQEVGTGHYVGWVQAAVWGGYRPQCGV